MGFFGNFFSKYTTSNKTIMAPRRAFFFRGNTVVNEDSAIQVAAFYRGLIYISSQIAKLPWDIKDADNKIVRNSISNLLNLAPNDEMNSFVFRNVMVQQAIIHGNAYAEIERNTIGAPIALWPLCSTDMELVRSTGGKLAYRYTSLNSDPVYLDPEDVFHLRNFHTKDGLLGQGIVAYGRDILGIQIAADQMASGIFHNSGIPSGLLKHKGTLSDEAYKRLKASWDEQTSGKKTGTTSILEEDMSYEVVSVEPEALQFLQSRQFGILEIARFLGVPPTKLFDVTAATFSNVENANLEVATDTLDSWATNLELEADVKILNYRYGGRFTDIDLYSIFRGDMKTRADYFKAMMSVAAITPNQIRAREGLPGYGKEGDNYYIATNNLTPVDRMDEVIDADITQKTKPNATPATPPADKPPAKAELESAVIRFLDKK